MMGEGRDRKKREDVLFDVADKPSSAVGGSR